MNIFPNPLRTMSLCLGLTVLRMRSRCLSAHGNDVRERSHRCSRQRQRVRKCDALITIPLNIYTHNQWMQTVIYQDPYSVGFELQTEVAMSNACSKLIGLFKGNAASSMTPYLVWDPVTVFLQYLFVYLCRVLYTLGIHGSVYLFKTK